MTSQTWFASEVLNYSSQYGKIKGTAYSANNIVGIPRIYPEYSDDDFNFSFLNYGNWWKMSPQGCAFPSIDSAVSMYPCDEFIDVFFSTYICVTGIDIYETYCPGAVHTIRVCYFNPQHSKCVNDMNFKWKTLWKRPLTEESPPKKSRIFSPQLVSVPTPPVLVIRLELDCSASEYFPQLDAVRVSGWRIPDFPPYEPPIQSPPRRRGSASHDEAEHVHICNRLHPRMLALTDTPRSENGYFENIPYEGVLTKIFHYLPWSSLCRLAQVSKLLREQVYAYMSTKKELSLRYVWYNMDDDALIHLHNRMFHGRLQRLDLSWCGPYEAITEGGFSQFLHCGDFGERFVTLKLGNCNFVTGDSLLVLSSVCQHLHELDLSFCKEVSEAGFNSLSRLIRLRWLNVSGTHISDASLISLVHSCPKLRHLNIALCHDVASIDELLLSWAQTYHAAGVISLNLWHSQITYIGLQLLTEYFTNLQEINLGYCSRLNEDILPGVMTLFLRTCTQLKKIVLTKCRSLADDDVQVMSKLPHLEQLEVAGAVDITENAVNEVLAKCGRLKLLDVSFCDNISHLTVRSWRGNYPSCEIKKSHNHRLL